MTQHKITVEGLDQWLRTARLQYASSTRENKQLWMECGGWLRVTINFDQTVYEGKNEQEAVDAYNAITKEYTQQ